MTTWCVLLCLKRGALDLHWNWRSEFSNSGWKDTKEWSNLQLNTSGAPPECWLLVLAHVDILQNHIACKRLGWRTSIKWLLGYTPDISVFLQFIFYEPVLYMMCGPSFPKDSTELIGRFESVGHGMTFLILTETGKVISCSVVSSALGCSPHRNLRATLKGG
jgi:hypothetical protein